MMSLTSLIPRGSSPVVGSSNRIIEGLPSNAEAMHILCFIPLENLPSVVKAEKTDDKNVKIIFNGGLDVQERLLNDIIKLNIGVISYKAASSELEEVYLKLITATL